MPRPKPEVELIQIAVRLTANAIARVDAEAARSGRSRNGVISDAVNMHIADRNGMYVRRAREAERITTWPDRRPKKVRDAEAAEKAKGSLVGFTVQGEPIYR